MTTSEGYINFATQPRRVKAELFKIEQGKPEERQAVDLYYQHGLEADLRFVRLLYGLINFADRREFGFFWESPFTEEHTQETIKRRRLQQQQRQSNLSRVIGMAESTAEMEQTWKLVKKLEEQDTVEPQGTETIKTVSRVVQSFEKRAVRNLLTLLRSTQAMQQYVPGYGMTLYSMASAHFRRLTANAGEEGEVEPIVNTLRRCGNTYDLFAQLVAAELNLLEGTSGARITSIHLSKRLQKVRDDAQLAMLGHLDTMQPSALPVDTLKMPLMQLKQKLIVRKGAIVCASDCEQALWVLQLKDFPADGDLSKYDGVDIQVVTAAQPETAAEELP